MFEKVQVRILQVLGALREDSHEIMELIELMFANVVHMVERKIKRKHAILNVVSGAIRAMGLTCNNWPFASRKRSGSGDAMIKERIHERVQQILIDMHLIAFICGRGDLQRENNSSALAHQHRSCNNDFVSELRLDPSMTL